VLYSLIASSQAGDRIVEWIEIAALVIELLAVLIIVFAIVHATVRFSLQAVRQREIQGRYRQLKIHLGRALLLGLEILRPAPICDTIALEATLESVAVQGMLVLMRTFLSWALVVEIEGRWPWQPKPEGASELD
jgi:uncharacterized membrane protein